MTRILIVDDDEAILKALRRLLALTPCTIADVSQKLHVDCFSLPLEALEKARHTAYALVLSDYRMPLMNGVQLLKAIRENEPRTISLGYDADKFKHRAFVLSAALSGLAGGTKAIVFQLASLTDVHWSMSGEVVLMTLVGGLGTIFGPVVGAAVIVTMQNYLAQLGAWVTVVQGVIFVVCVLLFRRGIVGEIGHLLKKSL